MKNIKHHQQLFLYFTNPLKKCFTFRPRDFAFAQTKTQTSCIADERPCFRYIDSTIHLPPKSLAMLYGCTARLVSDLVGNPEDRFSPNAAQN